MQLTIIFLSAFVLTLIMSFMDAYERLYLFTRMYNLFAIDEFAVFLPAFLAMGFLIFSYHQIQTLELEIIKRTKAEKALRESEGRYREQSITDDLTKLYNSRYFYAQLESEVDRVVRYGHQVSLLLLDIDDFKHYNDTYGHLEGDKVLAQVGKMIRESLRQSDSAYRYGGEEFTAILPETDGNDAIKVAERMRMRFETKEYLPRPEEKIHKTMSIGVSQYKPKEEMAAFIKRADNAMYTAKREGKNRVRFEIFTDREETPKSA
jgi:diguanylate cyclase (GGDEF)-like protein